MDSPDDIENQKTKLVVATTSEKVPHDDVDFTSGFETQYVNEYRPSHTIHVAPMDKSLAWYRDLSTILMVAFLMAIFLFGTVMLVTNIFTANPLQVFIITMLYLIVAGIFIFIEVKSIHVR